MKAIRITIEGRTMTGKTTIAGVIAKALEKAGYNVVQKPVAILGRKNRKPNALIARETSIVIEEQQIPRPYG